MLSLLPFRFAISLARFAIFAARFAASLPVSGSSRVIVSVSPEMSGSLKQGAANLVIALLEQLNHITIPAIRPHAFCHVICIKKIAIVFDKQRVYKSLLFLEKRIYNKASTIIGV